MLKVVYPAVKAADPNSKVILGGLLLDCDPNNPPAGKDCSSSRFLEGVLADGAGPYFDAVGYHAYDYYQGNGSYINGNWHADLSTGPSSAIRDQFVKSVLQPYGYQNKPLFNTETSLVCMDNPNDPNYCTNGYENTKAAYVALDYAMAMANSVSVRIWYNVIGEWRHSGLLNSISSPRPAYDAFKTGATELGYATFVKDLTQPQLPSGVRGYQFTRDNRTVWFLWSTSVSSHQVTFNRAPANAFDTVGHALTPAQTMSVDNNPRYFEWIGNP
jgi:hypothetical protein